MADDLKQMARRLVQPHREAEPNLKRIVFYPDPAGAEVRLLEVVEGSPSLDGIYPLRFAPNAGLGFPFPTVMVEVSPGEFERLNAGALTLPPGWDQEHAEVLYST